MTDGARELRTEREQECFFLFGETPALTLPHDQHTEHGTVLDNRHTEKAVIDLFTDLAAQNEIGVVRGVVQVERFFAAHHLTHQPLAEVQSHLPDDAGAIAVSGHHHILLCIVVDEVNRTDIDRHGLFDARDDDIQGT